MLAAVLLSPAAAGAGCWRWGSSAGHLAAELGQWWFGSPDYLAMALLALRDPRHIARHARVRSAANDDRDGDPRRRGRQRPPRPRIDGPDIELLRAFEPVVRYTKGESFLPMSVATYLASAVRMRTRRSGHHEVVGSSASCRSSTSATSARRRAGRDYLTVAGVGGGDDVATIFERESRQAVGFHSHGGRLARVGYASRLIDAMFAISLLARGRVPGRWRGARSLRYRAMSAQSTLHPYYGRVVRTATWTALQYWFFYAFNDWRSGFNGANDHEADWEQVLVYLDTDDRRPRRPGVGRVRPARLSRPRPQASLGRRRAARSHRRPSGRVRRRGVARVVLPRASTSPSSRCGCPRSSGAWPTRSRG